MKNKKEHKYKCQKCGNGCQNIYGDKTNKLWICETCWDEEGEDEEE